MIHATYALSIVDDQKAGLKSVEEYLLATAQGAFSGIEFVLSSDSILEEAEKIRELCYKHQIAPASGVISLSTLGLEPNQCAETYLDALDTLGVEQVVIEGVPATTKPWNDDSTRDHLVLISESCTERGLTVTYRLPRLDRTAPFLAADEDDTRVVIDVGPDSPPASLEQLGQWGDRVAGIRTRIDGLIDADLKQIGERLESIQFSGWITICGTGNDGPGRAASALRSLERLQARLETQARDCPF